MAATATPDGAATVEIKAVTKTPSIKALLAI